METATLGRDGPLVSRIGLGLAAIGRPAYITTNRAADLGGDRSVDTLRELDVAAARRRPRVRRALHRRRAFVRVSRSVSQRMAREQERCRRRGRGLQVGIHLRRRLGHGRSGAGGEGSLAGHLRASVRRDACAARRSPLPLPGALADDRVRGYGGSAPAHGAGAAPSRRASCSASRPQVRDRPIPSAGHWRSGSMAFTCSRQSRRPGTSSSRRPGPHLARRRRRDGL